MLSTALLCLALNVYHEARGESIVGQRAVAQVTLNRAKTKDRVCDEVFRPYQFSWANELTTTTHARRQQLADKYLPRDPKAWATAKRVARKALAGMYRGTVRNSTHYHTHAVRPKWASSMKLTMVIGNHRFYSN